jgi:hypothetical protein
MGVLALLVGIAVAVEGLIGMIAPGALLAAGRMLVNPAGLIAAGVVRVVIGGVLLGASRASRFPRFFQALGIFIIIAGLATPVLGVDRARALVEWLAAQGGAAVRIVAALAMLLGAFIAYAARGSNVKAL